MFGGFFVFLNIFIALIFLYYISVPARSNLAGTL